MSSISGFESYISQRKQEKSNHLKCSSHQFCIHCTSINTIFLSNTCFNNSFIKSVNCLEEVQIVFLIFFFFCTSVFHLPSSSTFNPVLALQLFVSIVYCRLFSYLLFYHNLIIIKVTFLGIIHSKFNFNTIY